MGSDRDRGDDFHSGRKSRPRIFAHELALSARYLLTWESALGLHRRVHGVYDRWLAVCLPVLFPVCQRQHLHMVVRRSGRVRAWAVSLSRCIAALAVRTSTHGFGISWRDGQASAGAAGLPGHELRLRNSCYDPAGSDSIRRDIGRLLAAAADHDQLTRWGPST